MSEREPGDWELADLHYRDTENARDLDACFAPGEAHVRPVILGGEVIGETDKGYSGSFHAFLYVDGDRHLPCGMHATRAEAEQAVREAAIIKSFRDNPNRSVWIDVIEREGEG